jgi:hypothetical protein
MFARSARESASGLDDSVGWLRSDEGAALMLGIQGGVGRTRALGVS